MKSILAWLSVALVSISCQGGPVMSGELVVNSFDEELVGWRAASTGGAGPTASWEQGTDRAPVSAPGVLAVTSTNHDSESRFNLYWTDSIQFQDGMLAVAVRGDDGEIDQGGGPMWRVQDADNYYVCRFNPLEANYRVYVVEGGVRRQLATALAPVTAGNWHFIAVEHRGDEITCWLDAKKLLQVRDGTIAAAGGVGLWTKADARTSFDDLKISGQRQPVR